MSIGTHDVVRVVLEERAAAQPESVALPASVAPAGIGRFAMPRPTSTG